MPAETRIAAGGGQVPDTARFGDYVRIARLDHSTKHVFIVPGMVLAYLLRGLHTGDIVLSILLGAVAAVSIASANYVINEWLDREFDRHHPTKSARPVVNKAFDPRLVGLEWLVLVTVGLAAAYAGGVPMFLAGCLFAMQGVVYNVAPLRTKDRPVLDVISESINNPLRLVIGWSMVDPYTLPPSSVILAYWLGGAFLMAAKRLSEYRQIVASHGKDLLVRYRRSFAGYSEVSLTASCFVYTTLSSFFLAVFLVKYRIEYILVMPVVTALFGQYLVLAMRPDSSAQAPEKLFRETSLVVIVALLAATFVFATIVDIPILEDLTSQRFISLGVEP